MPRDKPRFRRWTADTEIAFLMALRVTGSVTRACAEIGRSTNGAAERRRRMPDFAAKWQAVLDEWQAEQAAGRRAALDADGPGLMANRARYDGFTPLRQRAFLRALTETGAYREACARVGLSDAGVRAMRRRHPGFATACDRALARSAATLEQAAFERAVDGVEEPVFHAGRQVGTRRRYSDALLRELLSAQGKAEKRKEEAERRAPRPRATKQETDAAILKKLAAMAAQDERLRAEAAAAIWQAWQAGWRAFGREMDGRETDERETGGRETAGSGMDGGEAGGGG